MLIHRPRSCSGQNLGVILGSTHNPSLSKPAGSDLKMDPAGDHVSPPRLLPPPPPRTSHCHRLRGLLTAFSLAPRLQPGPQGSRLFLTQRSIGVTLLPQKSEWAASHLRSTPTGTSRLTVRPLAMRLCVLWPRPHLLLICLPDLILAPLRLTSPLATHGGR